MMKAEEIALLRGIAAKLGPNSYCGPWLASVADEVASEIRSDFFPTPSIAATRVNCDLMIAEAKRTANDIEADARTKADKLVKDAYDRVSGIKDRAAIELRSAISKLEGWA